GVYLPVSLMTPILIGGLMRQALTRKYAHAGETEDGVSVLAEKREQGVLYASGLIAGAALVGVLIGGAIYAVVRWTGDPEAGSMWQLGHEWMDGLIPYSSWVVGALAFAALCAMLWRAANRPSPS
ncbi:MAG: OPT/YSL family transporter, partial [Gemmatimonadota bacterium]|nr:OPT/YSL family transporter [Gemmatimonadota bacterium]